jgi:antitoxin component of MazEF toxin-antitoxin module
MPTIIKSSDDNKIAIPTRLMEEMDLREGDEVKAIVDGETLRLSRLDKFLSLRGSMADDEDFDRAMELINQSWLEWKPPASA